jgi:hypothetical protein
MKQYPMLFIQLHPANGVKNIITIKNEIQLHFVMKAIRLIAPNEKWLLWRKSDDVVVAQSTVCKASKAYIALMLWENERTPAKKG